MCEMLPGLSIFHQENQHQMYSYKNKQQNIQVPNTNNEVCCTSSVDCILLMRSSMVASGDPLSVVLVAEELDMSMWLPGCASMLDWFSLFWWVGEGGWVWVKNIFQKAHLSFSYHHQGGHVSVKNLLEFHDDHSVNTPKCSHHPSKVSSILGYMPFKMPFLNTGLVQIAWWDSGSVMSHLWWWYHDHGW